MKNNIWNYIKSVRPIGCLYAALLLICSSYNKNLSPSEISSAAAMVFLICAATMAQNDYDDRFHDAEGKGKIFAFTHEKSFKKFTILLWFLSIISVILAYIVTDNLSVVCWGIFATVFGVLYQRFRKIPFASNAIVSLMLSTVVVILAPQKWFFAILIFIISLFREIVKDLEDANIDKGYKWSVWQIIEYRPRIKAIHLKYIADIILVATLASILLI